MCRFTFLTIGAILGLTESAVAERIVEWKTGDAVENGAFTLSGAVESSSFAVVSNATYRLSWAVKSATPFQGKVRVGSRFDAPFAASAGSWQMRETLFRAPNECAKSTLAFVGAPDAVADIAGVELEPTSAIYRKLGDVVMQDDGRDAYILLGADECVSGNVYAFVSSGLESRALLSSTAAWRDGIWYFADASVVDYRFEVTGRKLTGGRLAVAGTGLTAEISSDEGYHWTPCGRDFAIPASAFPTSVLRVRLRGAGGVLRQLSFRGTFEGAAVPACAGATVFTRKLPHVRPWPAATLAAFSGTPGGKDFILGVCLKNKMSVNLSFGGKVWAKFVSAEGACVETPRVDIWALHGREWSKPVPVPVLEPGRWRMTLSLDDQPMEVADWTIAGE